MQHHRSENQRRPAWHDLAERFADERECLASFIALETAEVLAGKKPANLISILNRRRSCGRNLYRLWRRHGIELLGKSGLAVRELADRGDSLLVLIYRRETLAALLARPNVTGFLGKAGYPNPENLEESLGELHSRISARGFPHEIGVFLGYPLKDVAGFMGWAPLPFTCQGPWKIYGDPTRSLGLAETFRQCRCRMALRLARCTAAADCLKVAGAVQGPAFSGPAIENRSHFQAWRMPCASPSSAGWTV